MAERRNAAVGMTQSPYRQNPRAAGQGVGAPVRYPSAQRAGAYGAPSRSAKNPPQPQKGKKRSRRERDYFFVMRKGVCFLMLVVSVLMIAVLALSFLNVMPSFTSMYVKPDLTPKEDRLPTEVIGEDGNPMIGEDGETLTEAYKDKSEYIGISDPIYGLIAGFTGGSDKDDVTAEAAENGDESNPATTPAEGEGEGEKEEAKPKSPFYDDIEGQLEAMTGEPDEVQQQDGMLKIAGYVFKYGPIAFAVTAILALLVALKSLFGMFGRRIFRGFFISALLMIICGLVTVVMGLIASGVIQGNPSIGEDGTTLVSVLDFSGIMDFITQTFATFPADAEEAETAVFLTFKLGYGALIMVVLPIVLLILSFFAKRKVPYSIFDR